MKKHTSFIFGLLAIQCNYCRGKHIYNNVLKSNQDLQVTTSIDRQLKGDNCFPTASVTCKLQSDNSKCDNIIVQPGECGIVPVQYKFKFCNTNKKETITLKKNKTFGKIFNKKISVNTNDLPPGKCRTKKVNYKLNTCTKQRVNGQLKVEGKIPIQQGDDYCYGFDFYSKQIKKLEAATKPPDVELTLECYVESEKGSGNYDKECDDLEVEDFSQSVSNDGTTRTRRNLEESDGGSEGEDSFIKDFLFIYALKNDSGEDVLINDVTVLFNEMEFELADFGEKMTIPSNKNFTSVGDVVSVDLTAFNGESMSIGGKASLTKKLNIETGVPIPIP